MEQLTRNEVEKLALRAIPHNAMEWDAAGSFHLIFRTVRDEQGCEAGPSITVGPFTEDGAQALNCLYVSSVEDPEDVATIRALEFSGLPDDYAEAVVNAMRREYQPCEWCNGSGCKSCGSTGSQYDGSVPGTAQAGDRTVSVTAEEAAAIRSLAAKLDVAPPADPVLLVGPPEEEDAGTVTAGEILAALREELPGMKATVEQTGGSTATIYAGGDDTAPAVVIGPGSYDWSAPFQSEFYFDGLYVGPADAGEAAPDSAADLPALRIAAKRWAIIDRYDTTIRANETNDWRTRQLVADSDNGIYGAWGEVMDLAENDFAYPPSEEEAERDAQWDALEACFHSYQDALRRELQAEERER